MKTKYLFIVLGAFAVGLGLAALVSGKAGFSWFGRGAEKSSELTPGHEENGTSTGTPSDFREEGNTFVVGDQGEGDLTVVSSVAVLEDTWVAVEEERDGARASVLGATRIARGEYEEVRIELLRNMYADGSYSIVLRRDDGIAGFDSAKDLPLQNSRGEIIRKPFRVVSKELAPQESVGASSSAITKDGCVVSGCNHEECTNPDTQVLSACIILPQFACYTTATCGKRSDGECGWIETEELTSCLAQYD